MKAKIVVVGSSNTDMILKLDRIPKPGETILGGEFVTAAGGKGANQAVAAAKAGELLRLSPVSARICSASRPSLVLSRTGSTSIMCSSIRPLPAWR